MGFTLARRLATVLATFVAVHGVVVAGTAQAAENCDYSFSTKRYGCNGTDVRGGSDVIAARIFTGSEYTGDRLTIWVPKPCPKNDKVDHMLALKDSQWRNHVGSVQAWSSCWVWLYFADGNRNGPFKGNHPDLAFAGNRTVTIGLS